MTGLVWILAAAFAAGWLLWRRVRAARLATAFLARGAVVVDVRTPAEFLQGHAPGALNMPLDRLASLAGRLDPSRPVLVCCASGARSARAARMLRERGLEAGNAGPWTRLVWKE